MANDLIYEPLPSDYIMPSARNPATAPARIDAVEFTYEPLPPDYVMPSARRQASSTAAGVGIRDYSTAASQPGEMSFGMKAARFAESASLPSAGGRTLRKAVVEPLAERYARGLKRLGEKTGLGQWMRDSEDSVRILSESPEASRAAFDVAYGGARDYVPLEAEAFARGVQQTGSLIPRLFQMFANRIPAGKEKIGTILGGGAADLLRETGNAIPPGPKITDPGGWKNPRVYTTGVAEAVPSYGAMLAGYALGGRPGGAIVGGLLEAAGYYDELLQDGTPEEEAFARSMVYGAVSSKLNDIGLGKMLDVGVTDGLKQRVLKTLGGMGWEGATEYGEEVYTSFDKFANTYLNEGRLDWAGLKNDLVQGLNVIPGAAGLGGAINVAGQAVDTTRTRRQERAGLRALGMTEDEINRIPRAERSAIYQERFLPMQQEILSAIDDAMKAEAEQPRDLITGERMERPGGAVIEGLENVGGGAEIPPAARPEAGGGRASGFASQGRDLEAGGRGENLGQDGGRQSASATQGTSGGTGGPAVPPRTFGDAVRVEDGEPGSALGPQLEVIGDDEAASLGLPGPTGTTAGPVVGTDTNGGGDVTTGVVTAEEAAPPVHQMTYEQLRTALESQDDRRDLLRTIFPEYTEKDRGAVNWANDFEAGIWREANLGDERARVPMVDLSQRHRRLIQDATDRGETIPDAVLEDYPDLVPTKTQDTPAAEVGPNSDAAPSAVAPPPGVARSEAGGQRSDVPSEPSQRSLEEVGLGQDAQATGKNLGLEGQATSNTNLGQDAQGTSGGQQADSVVADTEALEKTPNKQRFEAVTPQEDVRVRGRWRVVDVSDLTTSDQEGYEDALQPRNRDTAASREQVAKIATGPDATRLAESPGTDSGAPLIDPRGMVVSGNGRTMGIREAYRGGRAEAYREGVLRKAQSLGIATGDVANPVLVREILDSGGERLERVAELSNRPPILARSEAEQAEADAKTVADKNLMRLFNPDQAGNVRAASNREFLKAFVNATGDQSLRTADGGFAPSVDGRVRRAVLAAVFQKSDAGRRVIAEAIENAEGLGIKRVLDGVMMSGGRLLKLADTKPDLDLTPWLGRAMQELIQYKKALSEGTVNGLGEYVGQGDLFMGDVVGEIEILVRELDGRQSIKAVRAFLDRYIELAGAVDTTTGSLFGDAVPMTTIGELVEAARDAGREERGGEGRQTELPETVAEDREEPAERAGGDTRQGGVEGGEEVGTSYDTGGLIGRTLADIGEDFPADPVKPELLPLPSRLAQRSSEMVRLAAEIFLNWPQTVRAADGATIQIYHKEQGRLSERVKHLLRMKETGQIDQKKFQWFPNVVDTLRHAAIRLDNPHNNTKIYVRGYADSTKHFVVVSAERQVVGQGIQKGRLITQFPHGNQGVRRLRVEWERGEYVGTASEDSNKADQPSSNRASQAERTHLSQAESTTRPKAAQPAPPETEPEKREYEASLAVGRIWDRAPRGIAVDVAEKAIARLLRKWRNGPKHVYVVADASGVPEQYRLPNMRGVYIPATDTVYVVAGMVDSPEQAAFVAIHEVVGHRGVEAILGAGKVNEFYGRLARARERDIRAYAKVTGKAFDTNRDKIITAKEWLADRIGRGELGDAAKWWDRLLELLKGALDRILGRETARAEPFGDEGLEALARAAHGFSEKRVSSDVSKAAPTRPGSRPGDAAALPSRLGPDIWYSKLRRVLDAKLPGKGTAKSYGEAVQGYLRGGDFKAAELQESGLAEWLGQQQGALTKDQVMDYLDEAAIEVREVMKGGNDGLPEGVTIEDRGDRVSVPAQRFAAVGGPEDLMGFGPTREAAIRNTIGRYGQTQRTKFSAHSLPGGEDYREMLFTLPQTQSSKAADAEIQALRDRVQQEFGRDDRFVQLRDIRQQMGEAFAQEYEKKVILGRTDAPYIDYSGPHWKEPNVLAHVRFNVRETADGKRVVFLEEVQSDWHQAGRKKGYGRKHRAELNRGATEERAQMRARGLNAPGNVYDVYSDDGRHLGDFVGESPEDALSRANVVSQTVPDAPFKKNWHELVLKRMLRWAVDQGLDGVAWTTGAQQADRYDLSKHIARIQYTKDHNLVAYNHQGKEVITRITDPEDLPDVIGKEAAEKILAQPEPNEYKPRELSGLDLRVGGEGMKGFYDKILPSFLNKYAKKWGAKVGESDILTGAEDEYENWQPVHFLGIPKAMREELASQPQPLYSTVGPGGEGKTSSDVSLSRSPAGGGSAGDVPLEPSYTQEWVREAVAGIQEAAAKRWDGEPPLLVDVTLSVLKDIPGTVTAMFRKASNAKPDLTLFDFTRMPQHAFEKVDALYRGWKTTETRVDEKHLYDNAQFGGDPNGPTDLTVWTTLRKSNKALYRRVRKYLVERDRDAVSYKVRFNPKTEQYEVLEIADRQHTLRAVKTGEKPYRASFARQDQRNAKSAELRAAGWETTHDYEDQYRVIDKAPDEEAAWGKAYAREYADLERSGMPEAGRDAVMAWRRILDRNLLLRMGKIEELIKDMGEDGLTVEESATMTELHQLIKDMGQLRGHYFPRQYGSGRRVLTATKGDERIVRHFDTPFMRGIIEEYYTQRGYKVDYKKSDLTSEDAFHDSGSILSRYDEIQHVIEKLEARASDEDAGFEAYGMQVREETYTKKNGETEAWLRIEAPNTKAYNDVFMSIPGHGAWDQHQTDEVKAAGRKVWSFPNPSPALKQSILRAYSQNWVQRETMNQFARAFLKEYADQIRAHGSQSAKIARKRAVGTDVARGYETDPILALTRAVTSTSGGLAKRNMAKKMLQIFTGTEQSWADYQEEHADELDGLTGVNLAQHKMDQWLAYQGLVNAKRISSSTQSNAFKAAKIVYENAMRNETGTERVVGVVRGLTAAKFLSRLFSSAVNATVLGTTYPAVMHGFHDVSFADTFRAMGRVTKEYPAYWKARWNGTKYRGDGEMARVFDFIEERGWAEAQYNKEAVAAAQSKMGRGMNATIEALMLPFSLSEKYIRMTSIAGGYWAIKRRMEKDGKWSDDRFDDAMKEAREASDKTNQLYHKANIPVIGQGSGATSQLFRSWYMFRRFTHGQLDVLFQLGLKRKDAKGAAWMLVAPAILAGPAASYGFPFLLAAVKALLWAIPGVQPLEDDPDQWLWDQIAKWVGDGAPSMMRYGVAGAFGVNLQGSLALMDRLPSHTDDVLPTLGDAAGAPWAALRETGEGVGQILSGNVYRGIETAAPGLIAQPMRAFREYRDGMTKGDNSQRFYGNQQIRPDAYDSFIRAIGGNPRAISEKLNQQYGEYIVDRNYAAMKNALGDRYKEWYVSGGVVDATYENLLEDFKAYNDRLWTMKPRGATPITDDTLRTWQRNATTPSKRERTR